MRICIDTNIYSLFKNNDADMIELLENADEIVVPIIVIGELLAGFYSGTYADRNIRALNTFLEQPGISVAEIDRDVADRYGEIYKILKVQGTPVPTNDLWIAAIVLETGSKLASMDKHFAMIPGIVNVLRAG